MDMALISGTITSLRTVADITKTLIDLKVDEKVRTQLIALQNGILSAQQNVMESQVQQMAMSEEIRTLKEQIANFGNWQNEAERYKLTSPWGNGGVVYALIEAKSNGELAHYLCPTCFTDRKKSIMNPCENAKGWCGFRCTHCKTEVSTGFRGSVPATYAK